MKRPHITKREGRWWVFAGRLHASCTTFQLACKIARGERSHNHK